LGVAMLARSLAAARAHIAPRAMLAARAGSVGLRENVRHMCTQNSDVSFKATLAEFAQTAEETLKIPGFPEQLKPVLESMIAKKAAWDKNDELNPEYVAAVEAFMAKVQTTSRPSICSSLPDFLPHPHSTKAPRFNVLTALRPHAPTSSTPA